MKTSIISQQDQEVHITKAAAGHISSADFKDTFSTTNHEDSLELIVRNILTTQQRWIIYLFQLRNWLAKFFGLQTVLPDDHNERFAPGGYVGFFRIYELLPNEIILGADDSHLNFRLSVHKTEAIENNVKVTTLVHFNNRLGRIYMAIVAPFHRLIVKRMVAQAYQPNK
ncbi:MAG: DUF2867 domain-containing protein [Bacteroidota bacterium]